MTAHSRAVEFVDEMDHFDWIEEKIVQHVFDRDLHAEFFSERDGWFNGFVRAFPRINVVNGFVDSADMKSSATRVTKSVDGVKSVSNNLQVGPGSRTAGEVVDDTVITAKVKTALATDPTVAAHEVNVETRDGVVQLAGFVDNSDQKSKATEVTRHIAGVKQVDNQLEVKQR